MGKTALFDIDGVVADTGKAMVDIVQVALNKPWVSLENITQYDITKLPWLNEIEIKYLLTKFSQPDFYYSIAPMLDATEITNNLKEKGWQVIFLTARPSYLYNVTLYWLKKHKIFFDNLIISLAEEKINYCINSSQCFLVEDRVDFLIEVAKEMPEIKLFIYDQPWNRHFTIGKRIKTLREITKVL